MTVVVAADDALRASDAFAAGEAIAMEEGDGKLTHRAFDGDEEARAFLQRIWDEVFA